MLYKVYSCVFRMFPGGRFLFACNYFFSFIFFSPWLPISFSPLFFLSLSYLFIDLYLVSSFSTFFPISLSPCSIPVLRISVCFDAIEYFRQDFLITIDVTQCNISEYVIQRRSCRLYAKLRNIHGFRDVFMTSQVITRSGDTFKVFSVLFILGESLSTCDCVFRGSHNVFSL